MDNIIKGYKLFRVRKDGTLGPLFINRKQVVPLGEWLQSADHPTTGFAHRQGWHCTFLPYAPHLRMILKSGEVRVWCEIEMRNTRIYQRPESQGGKWVLVDQIKVNRILSQCEVDHILKLSTEV